MSDNMQHKSESGAKDSSDKSSEGYQQNSLSLWGAVSLGTGVMIGAGIFALTGQMAELAREWFPLAFLAAALIAGLSTYSYIKMSQAWPSAGGIAMFLEKAYGKSTITGACALLMYVSMVINESLVARTFGTYTLQIFKLPESSWWVPVLGVGLLIVACGINLLSNTLIQHLAFGMAVLKISGLVVLAAGGLWATGLSFESLPSSPEQTSLSGFLAATALGILAYKGFTTITNSGGEIKQPHQNVGRAILIAIGLCVLLYLLVTLAVASTLSIDEIIKARDYSLAQAAQPAYGAYGVWVTVGFAIIATASGVMASMFAVSRMLAMLAEMELIPGKQLKLPGQQQQHTLVLTAALAIVLTICFDMARMAALGAIFYLIMDMAIHWGVYRYLRKQLQAQSWVLWLALLLDLVVLLAFIWVKFAEDPGVIWGSLLGLLLIFGAERWWLLKAGSSTNDAQADSST